MLKKRISFSKKLGTLKSDSARLLYTWLLPHLDVEGRYSADPDILKGHIFPKVKSMTPAKITKLLNELNEANLITLYIIDDEPYLQLKQFHKFQKIDKEKEAKSKIQPPTKDNTIPPTPVGSGLTQSYAELPGDNPRSSPYKFKSKFKYNNNNIKKRSEKYSELAALLERKIKEKVEKKEATEDEIKRIITWIFDTSDFWYKNILSADTLRKRFGRLWAESGLQRQEEERKKYQEWLGKNK